LQVDRYAVREATARGVAFLAAGEPAGWSAPSIEQTFTPGGNSRLAARFEAWRREMAQRGAR
jgi:hypothetical protein